MTIAKFYNIKDNTAYLEVVIAAGAKRDKIIGIHGDRLKISISAPPVDGKANEHLLKFLSKKLSFSKSSLTIIKGETSKRKTISIEGATSRDLEKLLEK